MQYGCGLCAPDGWVNFDASPRLFLPFHNFPKNVRYGDIVKGLPIDKSSCAGIYASHVLEHLALDGFERALSNTRSYMRPGGLFRLVVPDLEVIVSNYSASGDAVRFISETGMGEMKRRGFLRSWLGNSIHRWMWDEKAMRSALMTHGFVNIRRAQFGDSEEFSVVERQDRFVDALCMEASC